MISRGPCQSYKTMTLQTYRKYNWSSSSSGIIPTYLSLSRFTEMCQQLLNAVIQIEAPSTTYIFWFCTPGELSDHFWPSEKVMGPGWSFGITWLTLFASYHELWQAALSFLSCLSWSLERGEEPQIYLSTLLIISFLHSLLAHTHYYLGLVRLQPLLPALWFPSCYDSFLYSIVHLVTSCTVSKSANS